MRDDDCTYSQEEVQDAARAYMEDSTNFRSDSTNSESWDGLVDAIAEKFDEVEPGATAHASCCLWGLSSIVWQHLQTIFGIALCVKCLTPRSQPVSRLLERDQRHHQEQRQHQCGYKWFQQPEYHSSEVERLEQWELLFEKNKVEARFWATELEAAAAEVVTVVANLGVSGVQQARARERERSAREAIESLQRQAKGAVRCRLACARSRAVVALAEEGG